MLQAFAHGGDYDFAGINAGISNCVRIQNPR